MTDLAEPSTPIREARAVTRWTLDWPAVLSAVLRYGLSLLCVAVAVGLALTLQHYHLRDVELPVLTLAIAIATWYAGNGPAILTVLLSTAAFDYFFTEPLYTFEISTRDVPYFIIFAVWAAIVASFSAVRRQIEDNLRHAREELAQRAADLEAANRELEAFAYSVSHDLRAPLRHVSGYAELLQKQAASTLDEKSLRYMRLILDAAKRMGALIDDLLGFSRIGRAEAKMAPVNLDQLVRQVVAELAQDTSGRQIAWQIGSLPVCSGDRAMLRVVLMNLLSNAIKFTRKRERAEIAIGSTDGAANQVEIFVKDNGAGFDMQYANKLFGVFQRLHTAEEFEGTGIGLATVQRVIHRHGGQCRAEGTVDGGATFYFTLPRA